MPLESKHHIELMRGAKEASAEPRAVQGDVPARQEKRQRRRLAEIRRMWCPECMRYALVVKVPDEVLACCEMPAEFGFVRRPNTGGEMLRAHQATKQRKTKQYKARVNGELK